MGMGGFLEQKYKFRCCKEECNLSPSFHSTHTQMVATQPFIAFPKHGVHCSLSSSLSHGRSSFVSPRPTSISLHTQPSLRVRAGPNGDRSAAAQKASVQKAAIRRSPPSSVSNYQDPSLQTVLVEDQETLLEGVAKVDREELARPSWSRIALLSGGDVLALLAFAAIGRMSHGLSVFDWDAFRTADPFIAGWLIGSYFLGGYGPEGQGVKGLPSAIVAAAKSWVVGIPVGLVIRGVITGHAPVQAFILVSMASTFVLLVGWRTAFTAAFPNNEKGNRKRSGDRQGSIFELFELLTSLVRRW